MHLSLIPSIPSVADITDENDIILQDEASNKRIKLEEIFREAEKNSQRKEMLERNEVAEVAEGEDGRLNIDQIKEFLFYTREELSVVHDLMSRLLMSSTKDLDHLPDDENNSNLLRLSKVTPGVAKAVKNASKEITGLQYNQYCKSMDRKEFVQSLDKAIKDLGMIIEKENEFFNEFAFLLMERNWILRKRPDNPSLLYCTYGYRNDGSTFFHPGEADIWRQYHQHLQPQSDIVDENIHSTSAIEILTPHSRLCGVDVYLKELSSSEDVVEEKSLRNHVQMDWSKSVYLSDDQLPGIVKPLITSRISVFEQELFQSLLSSLHADPLLFQKSRISHKSMIIPISEKLCLVIKLDSETGDTDVDMQDSQISFETSRNVMDDFYSLLCRMSLIHLHDRNQRSLQQVSDSLESSLLVKPPIPYLVNLINHGKTRQVAQLAFNELLINTVSLKSSLKVSSLSKTSCKWIFSAQTTSSRKITISCTIVNQTLSLQSAISFSLASLSSLPILSFSNQSTVVSKSNPTTTHSVLFLNQLKSTLFSIMTQFISDWVYVEAKCLFGTEMVIKNTWGLQICTALNQSIVVSTVCHDELIKVVILMPDGAEKVCTISEKEHLPFEVVLRKLLLQFC